LIKTTGDGALATFDGPARAIGCASALRDSARTLALQLRQGIHIGEVERRRSDIGGIAVNLAARVQATAGPDQVLVTRTVADLVAGSGIEFQGRGEHELKASTAVGSCSSSLVDAGLGADRLNPGRNSREEGVGGVGHAAASWV
jgi:class 3 adenylate cyclase